MIICYLTFTLTIVGDTVVRPPPIPLPPIGTHWMLCCLFTSVWFMVRNLFRWIVSSTTLPKWWVLFLFVIFHPFESSRHANVMANGLAQSSLAFIDYRNLMTFVRPSYAGLYVRLSCKTTRMRSSLVIMNSIDRSLYFSVFGHPRKVPAHLTYPQYQHWWQT